MVRFTKENHDSVNSNEIITDYDFFIQLFMEEKELDFEMV